MADDNRGMELFSSDEMRVRAEEEGYEVELERPCLCGSIKGEFKKKFSGPHYAKITCYKCGRLIKWVANPDKKQPKRKSKPQYRPEIEYCELCGRARNELDGTATLEEHHVKEVQDWPELENEKFNIWVVCTRCHFLIHTLRRMVNGTGLKNGKPSA